jgi:Protein of unknown function (DUF3152)
VVLGALLGAAIRVLPIVYADDVRSAVAAVLEPSAVPAEESSPTPEAGTPAATWAAPPDSPRGGSPRTKRLTIVVVPEKGPGTFVAAHASGKAATANGRLFRFDVRVERSVRIDPQQAAELIQQVLNDRRSWRASGAWRFQLVSSPADADLHVFIATPGTTDKLCAPLDTQGELSCQNDHRVVLNAKRWVYGAASYHNDVANYRRYLINHEFGHALGFQHVSCGKGRLAKVMMQQTKGLDGCKANPWPYPKG